MWYLHDYYVVVSTSESVVWTLPSITQLSEFMGAAKRRIILIPSSFAKSKGWSGENLNLSASRTRFKFSSDLIFDEANLIGIKILLLFAVQIRSDNRVIEGKVHTMDSSMPTIIPSTPPPPPRFSWSLLLFSPSPLLYSFHYPQPFSILLSSPLHIFCFILSFIW